MDELTVSIKDVLLWENKMPDGFYGILINPRGESGFLSKIGGGTTWTAIREGQNDVEVMKAAKAFHDALSSPETVSADFLMYLGGEVEKLSIPKLTE